MSKHLLATTIACGLQAALWAAATVEAADGKSAQASGGSIRGTISASGTTVKTTGATSYKHVVVYLEPADKKAAPAVKKTVQMDQKGLVFKPHVMAVQKGTTVDFLNSDSINHNVFCVDDCCDGKMDLGQWGRGQKRSYTFDKVGPATLLCKLHPEMSAYVVVVDTPHFTIAAIDGESQKAAYSIANVPPGKYVLKTWHKKLNVTTQEVVIEDGKATTQDIVLKKKSRRRRRRR